jgi:hypothetical protein
MDAEGILQAGERGIHLLFDTDTIAEAFDQDGEMLQEVCRRRRLEIESVLVQLMALPTARDARTFIQSLPRQLQHVLVLLYFELLDGRLRRVHTIH